MARHGEDRIAGAAFISAVLPYLKLTDDNPEGAPEAALQATLQAFRADRPQWFARQAQVWFATHLDEVSPAMIERTVAQCLSVRGRRPSSSRRCSTRLAAGLKKRSRPLPRP